MVRGWECTRAHEYRIKSSEGGYARRREDEENREHLEGCIAPSRPEEWCLYHES